MPSAPTSLLRLQELGYAILSTPLDSALASDLKASAFRPGDAGRRCLLDEPTVRRAAVALREILVLQGLLDRDAKAIQAIAFDKTPHANWKVTWHQDVMFPFARPVTQPGFDLRSRKDGVDYARPPRPVLEALLAVRLHLDDCDEVNGPLRVAPGSHQSGVIPSSAIPASVRNHGEAVCTCHAGDALLMKPLLLHASSPASDPRHRRVLHLVYDSGEPISEPWYRAD